MWLRNQLEAEGNDLLRVMVRSLAPPPRDGRAVGGHARLLVHLQPARDRFKRFSDEQQAEFTDKVGAFVNRLRVPEPDHPLL